MQDLMRKKCGCKKNEFCNKCSDMKHDKCHDKCDDKCHDKCDDKCHDKCDHKHDDCFNPCTGKCEKPCDIHGDECIVCPDSCNGDVGGVAGANCCEPLTVTDNTINVRNAVLFPVEVDRIFDSIVLRDEDDHPFIFGEDCEERGVEFELEELCGDKPHGDCIEVTIEKVCLSFDCIDYNVGGGRTTVNGCEVDLITENEECNDEFEFNLTGCNVSDDCEDDGLGTSVRFVQRNVRAVVRNLKVEVKGRFGCSTFTAVACFDDEVDFRLRFGPTRICIPSRNTRLTQRFDAIFTIDCIGDARLVRDRHGCFQLCIDEIDFVLCAETTVNVISREQLALLGSAQPVQSRVLGTTSICENIQGVSNNNNKKHKCGCRSEE